MSSGYIKEATHRFEYAEDLVLLFCGVEANHSCLVLSVCEVEVGK
jgi:hypothetical protein